MQTEEYIARKTRDFVAIRDETAIERERGEGEGEGGGHASSVSSEGKMRHREANCARLRNGDARSIRFYFIVVFRAGRSCGDIREGGGNIAGV